MHIKLDGTENWFPQLRKLILGLFTLIGFILLLGMNVQTVQADGSVNLTDSGGDRPFLEYRNDLNAGILRRSTIYVYAQVGETIMLGSSAYGIGSGDINYVRPDGTTGSCSGGLIANRAQEIAGPGNPGGFTPCNVTVAAGQAGVWEIQFVSPNPANTSNPTPIAATAAWTQPNNVGYVTAWDVTVRNAGGTRFPGRVYANYLALNMGGNSRALSSRVYVQTRDGYRYMVDLNNMDPFGFIFFSSPLGLVDTTTGTPLYHSVDLEGPNPGSLPADVTIDVSGAAAHKLFFLVPDYANLPASAAIAGGTTWLDVPTVTPPPPTNFIFTGAEGTPGAGGTNPLGGYFSFDTVLDGSFSIWLDLNQDNTFGNANDRQLFGYASTGNNQIFWDGLDGLGAIVPASSQSYNAQIFLNAGEIHFPFIDVENNPSGFVIIRQVPATTPPDTSLLYWDDRTVTVDAGNVLPVPLYTLTGMPSSGGDHEFAGTFGDREAIENWTYLPTAPVLMTGGVTLQEADLEVIKSHSPANPAAGQPFSYSIVINNHGPSDSLGAIFTDTLPVEMLSPTWTCTVTVGTGSCSTASGTGSPINLTLDIPNGSQITVTVNGTLALNAGSPITNSASITRTDDITDPNLVNNTDDDVFSLSAGFTISKTADVTTVTAAGTIIHYTITLTNTGTMSLSGVNLTDPMLGTLSCTPALPATLAPGGVLNCTGSHTVSQAEMDSGTDLVNTVTADTNEVADQTASDTVTITQTPALTIDKSVTETSYSQAGDILHYTYLVTNSGNVTLTGPFTVTDDHATVTCPATATLAPLASITCNATYTVTAGDVVAGSVTNLAQASGGGVTSNLDQVTVPYSNNADLWLEKTASTLTPLFGDTLTFTLTVHNDGPSTATNVTVQDILPAGLIYLSDNGGGTYAGGIWTVGTLTAGSSASLNITVLVAASSPSTNYAQVMTSDQPDPDSTPGDDSITQDDDSIVTITPSYATLLIQKIMIGGVADFTYVGFPNGTISASGGFIAYTLAPGTYQSTETPIPGWTLRSITCNDTNSTGDIGTGTATFIAEAYETVTCVFTNEYTGMPSFSITKTADVTSVDNAGDVINYTVTLENTGNMVLNGVSVADPMLANLDCDGTPGVPYVTSGLTVAVGASLSCNGSYIVTQADMEAGLDLVNVVTGDTNETNSQTASDTVTITQNPALGIVKTATPATYDAVGDIISYSYLVTNSGNVTLTGPFNVTDDRATVTCPATATLAPNASITCTATYTITQADLDAGSVTNTAYASAEFNGTPVDSPTDSETVTADQNPALSIVKTATPATYDAVGDIISYSYLVTNTGNVTLTGPFTVTDDRATVTCPATATLAPLASITCTATYTITQADLDTGSVTNTAFAAGTFGGAPVVSPTDSETVTADQNPALGIVKTATPATYDEVGDIISYSYLVTNTGNVTLTGPFTVTDDRTTVTCPATATLAPLGTITCTATYTITQADLDAGSVTNTAFATGTFGGTPVDSPTDSETVTADQNPALSIVKTATPATYDAVGDIISYSYLVTNAGNVTLTGPFTVTDDWATVTCPATATLAPLGTITCTATYTITQADLNNGSVTNTAYATGTFGGTPVDSPTDSETVTADQNPALGIVKTATPATYDAVGDIISYSYLVTNTGNVTLTGPFTVTDDRATVTCPATASLAPLASITCTATYTIAQADLDNGSVTNTAYASGFFGGTPVDSPTDSETVTADQNPALGIVKTATPATYDAVGDIISYSYLVTNTGNVTLTGPFTVTDDRATVTCPATATLAPLASITCTATYTITQADLDAGSVTNTAFAAGTFGGAPVVSPTDSETITADQNPALGIVKTATPATYDAVGDIISYSYLVTNTGNVTLTGPFTVTDDRATVTCPATATLAPNASITCTATYIITQADLDTGSVTNTAFATGTFGGAPVVSPTDSETVTADQNPALGIVKTATPATYDAVGDIISYSYLVTNTGNVTLTGPFTVTDDRATVTCPATATLAPLGTITCTATYTITQADLDNGSVINTAYASGFFGGTPVDSPTDSETVSADQNPTLALLKQISASATGPWSASITIPEGSPVYYRFEITNTGNVSLSPVWVTDPDVSTAGCTFADPLLPGQSTACVVGPLAALSGTVVNTAHASGEFGGTTYDSADSSALYTGTAPDLSIVKSDAGVSVQPGDVIPYSLDYQNNGTGAATGVVVTETVPANTSFNPAASTAGWVCLPDDSAGAACTFTLGTVAAGTSGSLTFSVQVNNPLPAGVTQVANTASIADDGTQGSDPTPGDNSDSETTPVDAAPDFTITKTTSINLVLPGDVIVYTLTYADVGNQDATGVVISETVPANTSFVTASSTAGWSCADGSPAGTACTFSIGSLAAGTGGSLQFAVQVALNIPAGVETIGNFASISDDGTNGSDLNPGDNSDDESTPLDARPDLSITKTDHDGVGAPGGVVVYTLTITNNGTQAATGVVVTETVPQYTTFEAASSTVGWVCSPDVTPGSTCTFAITSISAGASRTLSFAVRIDDVLPAGVEQIANATSVSDDGSNGQDPNPGDNSDSDDTPVDASPNLSVVKTDGVTQVTPGAELTYTLTISNHGGQDATGITITDTLPEGLIFLSASDGGMYTSADRTITWTLPSLAAGASVTRTITVQVDPALNGEITFLTNVAEVADDGTNGEDPQPGDNTGEDTDLIGTAGKEIVAHSLPATQLPDVAIGELLTYQVNLTVNPGEVSNLVLTDVLDRGLAFVDCEVIAPAGLSAAPVALDQICSTAVVISTEPAGSSNPADAGRRMVATFGTVTNSAQQDLDLTVRYQVVVLDNAENLRGVQLNNTAQWTWTGGSLELVAPLVEIVEPALSLSKTVNQPSALPGSLLTYTLTLSHTTESNSDAYNVTLVDVLPGNLALVPGTLALVSGQAPTLIDTTNPTRPAVTWDVFLNNGEPTVIRFQAILGDLLPGQSAVNTANVSWTSMPGDISAPQSPFNPLSYERYFNPGSSVDVYGATASVDVDYPSNLTLPETGFAPDVITRLGPMDVTYAALGSVWVEIPNLGLQLPIVGVPLTADGWDVQWLNEQVGWLQETAFPGFKGNSVITAHVYDADGSTGPFVDLHTLKYGTKIIVHAYGSVYTYEVRTVQRLRPTDMTPLRHENKAWLTLITCQGFDEDTYTYTSRVVVRAVLVSVK